MRTTQRFWWGLTLGALLIPLLATPTGSLGSPAASDLAPNAPLDILTLYADTDATTKSWQPDANFGADTMLQIRYDNVEGPVAAFSLIHFDVSSIPADAVIDSAVMELYLWNAAGADPVWIGLYDVYAGWDESTVTWNTRPPGQTGGFIYGVNVDSTPGYKAWTVTGWVTYWRSNPNYGLELRGPIAGAPSYYDRSFGSKDGRVNLPRLVVTYHLPATPTATPTHTQIPDTPTPTITRTPTPTVTRTPTVTQSPIPNTATPTNSPTSQPSRTATWTPTVTRTPTVTQSPMPNTATPTNSPTSQPSRTATPTASATASPSPTSIPIVLQLCAVADAYIDQYNSSSNFGSQPGLRVGFSSAVDLYHDRALVRFDLSSIPVDATIRSAYLEAYLTRGSGSMTPVSLGAYFITNAWGESSVTWNTMPSWEPVGIARSVDASPGYKSWNVTDFARAWQSDPGSNRGLMLFGPQTNWWSREFSSREGAYCPRLVLTIESTTPILTPTPTNTPTPTPTPTAELTPESRLVQIVGVEVNQAIQTRDINTGNPAIGANPVLLIAGKTAVVRVHLRVVDGKGPIIGVRGYVHYPYPGGALDTYSPINFGGTIMAQANPSRAVIDDSLNFLIPGQAMQGSRYMLVRIVPPAGVSFSASGELQETRLITTYQTPPLRVVFVGVSYNMGGTLRFRAWNTVMNDIRSHLQRMYPVADVLVKEHPIGLFYTGAASDFCDGDAFESVNEGLADLRKSSNVTLGANTLYYGMVPDDYGAACSGGFVVGGMAADIPAAEASGGVYSGVFATGDKAAHELGHCLGRYHARDCCGAQGGTSFPYVCTIGPTVATEDNLFGLDTQTQAVYTSLKSELMGYCDVGSRWISDFTYSGLYSYISQFPLAAAQSAAPQDVLMVRGRLNKTTNQAELNTLYRLTGLTPDQPQSGPCAIVLHDADWQVLAQYPFTPAVNTSLLDGQEETVLLHRVVPDHPNLAWVEVQCAGEVLATLGASAHPPTVRVIAPNGGETWGTGNQTIAWEVADEDGDDLHFLVQVSTDDGATWTTLASDLTDTSLSFDAALLAGSTRARVRVVASDGLLTAQDTSDAAFTVARKPPQAAVSWPADGRSFRPGEMVVFSGYAWDPEDGPLADESLAWESDRDGFLGDGDELAVTTLSPGRHVITFSATDADDLSASATVIVLIEPLHVFLPVIRR